MIWLPGILSQGGEKTKWGKYSLAYSEKVGTEKTVSIGYSYSKKVSTAYTIQDDAFVLTNPQSKTAENLAAGDKLVDIANSINTATSGSTLYEVKSNSGRAWTYSQTSQSTNITTSYTIQFFTSCKQQDSNGYFVLSGFSQKTVLDIANNTPVFSHSSTFNSSTSDTGPYSEIYALERSGSSVKVYRYHSPSRPSSVSIKYLPYTLDAVRGTFIEDVKGAEGAYPDNGIQGDYWYVRYSDTPITWERYAVSQTAVEGSSTRATGVYNKYLKVGTTYSIENGEFAVTTTQSLRMRTSTSSFSAPYTILAGGTLSLQSSSQTTGDTVSGPMLGKLTRISGSSYNMYADFIPYTVGDVKGSYIDTVTSYNPYEFPDNGAQDGYWYVKIS